MHRSGINDSSSEILVLHAPKSDENSNQSPLMLPFEKANLLIVYAGIQVFTMTSQRKASHWSNTLIGEEWPQPECWCSREWHTSYDIAYWELCSVQSMGDHNALPPHTRWLQGDFLTGNIWWGPLQCNECCKLQNPKDEQCFVNNFGYKANGRQRHCWEHHRK